jgi:hypothetical protein
MLIDEGAGCLMVWETVPRNYFFIFFSSRILGFLFAVSNCTDGFMCLSNKEMKLEMNVISIVA